MTTAAVEALGVRTLGIEVDLTAEDSARCVVDTVVCKWGGFDFLVTVAGGAVTPFDRSGSTEGHSTIFTRPSM